MTGSKRTPPGREADLGTPGTALWESVSQEYELDVHEQLLLLEACRTADLLDRIATAAKDAELTVVNSRGDRTPNPLIIESRMQSAALARLLASLRLPSGEEGARPQRRGGARVPYGVRGAV